MDGEVGRGRVSRPKEGGEDPGRHARTVGRQLRLGPVRQTGAATAARVTGKKKRL